MRPTRRSSATFVAVISALAVLAVPTAASALWVATATGTGTGAALTMPVGPAPTATIAGANVTVSWSAVTLAGGTPVDGYAVARYDGNGQAQAVAGTCAGVVTTLTCVDAAVPTGSWRYTVMARRGAWVGAEGSFSSAISTDQDAPIIARATIQKGAGGITGWIRQAGSYRVFAQVTDAGGVASATADVSAITSGSTAVPLVAGSWTVAGVAYNFRSAALTTDGTLAAGSKAFSITATDLADNIATVGGFTVSVDNTPPSPTHVQATNGGGTLGRPEAGDTITLTYAEVMEPISFITNWNGAATAVTVRIVQANGTPGDRVEIWDAANTTQLTAFGTVRTGNTDHVTATVSFTGSTAVLSGASVTITLGTPSGATGTATANGTMRWTSDTGATDRAGNACSANTVNEQGTADIDF